MIDLGGLVDHDDELSESDDDELGGDTVERPPNARQRPSLYSIIKILSFIIYYFYIQNVLKTTG